MLRESTYDSVTPFGSTFTHRLVHVRDVKEGVAVPSSSTHVHVKTLQEVLADELGRALSPAPTHVQWLKWMRERDDLFVELREASLPRCVDLDVSEAFDLTPGRTYAVSLAASQVHVFVPDVSNARSRELLSHPPTAAVEVSSNTLVVTAPRAPSRLPARAAVDVVQINCSASEMAENLEALDVLMDAMKTALEYMDSSCLDDQYLKIFGEYSAERYAAVHARLRALFSMFSSLSYALYCGAPSCTWWGRAVSTITDSTHVLRLCERYFALPVRLRLHSRATALVAGSNFLDLGFSADYNGLAYLDILALARLNPNGTAGSAAAYAYFLGQGIKDVDSCATVAEHVPSAPEGAAGEFSRSCDDALQHGASSAGTITLSPGDHVFVEGNLEQGGEWRPWVYCGSSRYSKNVWLKVAPALDGTLSARVHTPANESFWAVVSLHDDCSHTYRTCLWLYDAESGRNDYSFVHTTTLERTPVLVRVSVANGHPAGPFTLELWLDQLENGDAHPHANESVFYNFCGNESHSSRSNSDSIDPEVDILLPTGSSGTLHGDFSAATPSVRFMLCDLEVVSSDVTMTFYVQEAALVVFEVRPFGDSTFDSIAAISQGCQVSHSDVIQCDNDSGPDAHSIVSVAALPYVRYALLVAPYGGSSGAPFTVAYSVEPVPADILGGFDDACDFDGDATHVPLGSHHLIRGAMFESTRSPSVDASICGLTHDSNDVWTFLRVMAAGELFVTTVDGYLDTVLSVHRSCADLVACDDDCGESRLSHTRVLVSQGEVIGVRVATWAGTRYSYFGEFNLKVRLVAAPCSITQTGADESESDSSTVTTATWIFSTLSVVAVVAGATAWFVFYRRRRTGRLAEEQAELEFELDIEDEGQLGDS